jgi:hypothetical protein
MTKEFEVCPLCGKENWTTLSEVKEGEPYRELHCEHLLWDPPDGTDFLRGFLKGSRNNPAIRVPQFHTLNLDAVPNEALEVNREKLEKILRDNLHEVNGWWFGTLEERETTCKELVSSLRPLCDLYSRHTQSNYQQ